MKVSELQKLLAEVSGDLEVYYVYNEYCRDVRYVEQERLCNTSGITRKCLVDCTASFDGILIQ